MPDFADRLKELRLINNLTQKEFSDVINVSQNAVYNWENRKREPSQKTIIAIAQYFKISPSYLMGWDETPSWLKLFSGTSGIEQTHVSVQDHPQTIAAHFDGDEYTEEELEEIRQFAEFVKNRRSK